MDAARGTDAASREFSIATMNGELRAGRLSLAARRTADNKLCSVVGVGQDVTQSLAAVEENKLVAQDLATLIDRASAPIVGVDTEGIVIEWNLKAADMSGQGRGCRALAD